jgi:alkylation response protein AidB-like acyl-CoA dehydrogenase
VDPARKIAEELLFPAAMTIDAAPVVPRYYLDALADAGLYDLDPDPIAAGRTVEALGGASLVTAFVWIQHHSVVRAIAAAGAELRDRWQSDLRAGRTRAGIAYAALRRPGPPSARAGPVADGWILEGFAPWVTGWGLIDVVLAGARHGDDVVWLLLDAVDGPGMTARLVHLAALQASSTVKVRWDGFSAPTDRVVGIEPFADWVARDARGRQLNGYLAIGVAARCCSLLGASPLDDEVEAARARLDAATPATIVDARARASLLAVRAATALVASGGGKSVEADRHPARLMREATFLLVFGQTRDIRARQLESLGAPSWR